MAVTPKVGKTAIKRRRKKNRDQINIRLDKDLIDWAHGYAKKRNTTLSWLIDDYLRELRSKDTEVPQI